MQLAIANAKSIADAAPIGTGGVEASKYTALLAGSVQNTSSPVSSCKNYF